MTEVAVFCHGKGNPETEGCCWVDGEKCPLLLEIVDGTVYDHQGQSLGTVTSFVNNLINGKPKRDAAVAQLTGPQRVCRAAVEVLANDPNLVNDRPGFEAAWTAHTAYQSVADHWEALGKPRSWCPEFGPSESQCCYAEDEPTNQSKRADLSAAAVTVRQNRSA